MITLLRKKFILIAMSSTFVVLAVIMGVMNILNYRRVLEEADRMTGYLAENGGRFDRRFREETPDKGDAGMPDRVFSKETPFQTRFFTVTLDEDGNAAQMDMKSIAAVSRTEAQQYAEAVSAKNKERGFQGIYRYRCVDASEGSMIIFVDCGLELDAFQNQAFISIAVSVGGLLAVFVLVLIFSKIVFRPVEESYDKQKRFITDASHEIKTPLTIIDANTEVIEMTMGECQWTQSTKNQVQRLSELTRKLVALTRMDEGRSEIVSTEFSVSEAVLEAIRPFETVISTEGKRLCTSIEEGVSMTGDEGGIRQLVGILMDNAVKYSLPESVIEISLHRSSRKISLSVANQAEGFPKENMDQLFERFYRLDSSRNSETGGSGIGLSIARMIVQSHKGKITAVSPDRKKLVITAEFRV